MKMSDAVSIYIRLRDQKAQLKADFEANEIAPLVAKMDKIEAKLLEVFNTTGMDSVKTEFGTAYATVRTTASIADREAFMAHIKAKDEWALLDVRVNKSAVEQFRSAHDDALPPGVNVREERVVNVRRSA